MSSGLPEGYAKDAAEDISNSILGSVFEEVYINEADVMSREKFFENPEEILKELHGKFK